MTDRPAARPADRPGNELDRRSDDRPADQPGGAQPGEQPGLDRPADQPGESRERLPALGRPEDGDAGGDAEDAVDDTGDFADEHSEAWVSEESPEGLDEPEAPKGHSGFEPTNRPY